MAMITVIVGSVGLFAVGFVAWYSIWRHRVASSFQRVPVRADRPAPVGREGDPADGIA